MAERRVLAVVRNPVGGIRTYLRYTYAGLDAARYAFTVLAVKSAESSQLHSDLAGLGARIIEVESPRELGRQAIVEARSGAHDLIHSHGLKSATAASPAAWISRLPHVVTSHDVFLPEQFPGLKGVLMKVFLTTILNRASVVHSVSAGADLNLHEYLPRVRAARRRVVMNGIPPAPLDDVSEARAWHSEMAPNGETLFGFFGRFMPQKGFEDIVSAVERLEKDEATRGRYRVIAVNDGAYIREYRADIERRGLTPRFQFVGFVPEVRRWMERVDAVLMPSLWEACGLVAMEAMSAGTPLIATAVHGLADVTADSPATVVAPRNPAALAKAMAALIAAPATFKQAALAYRDRAQRRFDVTAATAGLERIFDEVLSSVPNQARADGLLIR